tara:strand:- start:5390 stop:10105 length:4716 start_codon:yes stop_codon:yes gene_type:complete
MAEVIPIDPISFELQTYEDQDVSLITQFDIDTSLTSSSYIEFYVYDVNQNIISSNLNYDDYQVIEDGKAAQNDSISQFNISPKDDVTNEGFNQGEYIAYYNFLTKRIGDQLTNLYISEISPDRTEIRLDSSVLSNLDIVEQTNNFIQFREDSNYFVDFYLNFGDNNLTIANNIKLENETTDDPTILVKLYEPLPSNFDIKSLLWVVTTLNEPEAFQVKCPIIPITFDDFKQISGPNFNIPIKGQVNNSSQNLSKDDILSGALTSSLNQVQSLLNSSSININVDYTNFSDFVHFSSAQTRLENFNYKIGLIENYTSESNALSNVTSSNTSIIILENNISKIIENFDQFEYFLYYNSGSNASWPKSNIEPPYVLYPTTSSQVLTWLGSVNENNSNFGGQLLSASNFDNANPDQLKKAIPEYLREDPANQQYDLFVDMIAQYYDNIWLYTKDVTQKYNADNRLDFGVSKDLVADAIRDFGVKLYQNNFSNKDLYTAFLGLTPEGSVFPFPEITGSMPVPTGFEFVDTLISASNDIIPLDDVNKSLYKRIYHNIPYLLKSKGTISGLRALITSYGIPDTILKISEFGGKDQVNANDYDLYFNNFNFALGVGPNLNFVSSSWEAKPLWDAPNDRASTVQLRFKSEKISSNISPFGVTNLSQSLWNISYLGTSAELLLDYSGSGLDSGSLVNDSGSYSGSIKDPYYQYANLRFIPNNTQPTISASITLPFYNNDWWSVMVTTDQSGTFKLHAGNKIYNGNDGTSIGHYARTSVSGADTGVWIKGVKSIFASSSINFNSYKGFSGSLQEIRYYKPQISESVFKDYIMNPLSIEGNNINSAPEELIFRAPLGSEIDTIKDIPPNTLKSVHPRVTGSLPIRPSFIAPSNSKYYLDNAFRYNNGGTYHTNTEIFFLDQPAAGIKNRINDKIRFEDNVVPTGDTLSAFRRITQQTENSASYTDSINYLEAAFSPQNQINDDIIGQIGHFNIGDYIGDPRQRFEGNKYPELNELSEDYFKKYIKQYDLTDFVRLIKFFDNSLFKMIKDFIPARTSLASGLVVKQHLLERNKYPQPQVSFENKIYTGSIDMVEISGGAGGVFNIFNELETSPSGALGLGPSNRFGITQSWSENYSTLSGSVTKLYDNQDEFYDGIFSGSNLVITNGNLNIDCFGEAKGLDIYGVRIYNNDIYNQGKFLSFNNSPTSGYISLFNEPKATSSFVPSPSPPPATTIPNTPTTMRLTLNTMGTYSGDNLPLQENPLPGNIVWDFDERDNSGSAVYFVSSTQNPAQKAEIIFENQFGEVIQDITVVSLQVFQPLNGANDISDHFTTEVKDTSGTPAPSDNTLIFRSLTQSICLNDLNTETYAFNLLVSSSVTSPSTNALDGNVFSFSPRNPENNAIASLGNRLPFHETSNVNFNRDTSLETDWVSSIQTNMEVYKESDYWPSLGTPIDIISFPSTFNIGLAPAFNNGAGTTTPASLSLEGLQLTGLSGAGTSNVNSYNVFRDSPAFPEQPNLASNINGVGSTNAFQDFKFSLGVGGQLQVTVTNNSGEITSGRQYYVGISIKDAAATKNAMYTIAFYKT